MVAIAGPTMTITLTITRGSMNAQAMIFRLLCRGVRPALLREGRSVLAARSSGTFNAGCSAGIRRSPVG